MNPSFSNPSDKNGVFKFTLSNIDVSLANALRRTVLNDIPTAAFDSEMYENGKCQIHANTTRFHNEIVKHRLANIPIHSKDLKFLEKHIMELSMENTGETTVIVTTGDFKIKEKESGEYLPEAKVREIFPKDEITQDYIDFIRLRPKIGDSIPGERIHLTNEFSFKTANDSSTFTCVSKCAYGNTPDMEKVNSVWEKLEENLRSESLSSEDIKFEKRNFELLDAQRQFVDNSFDFAIQSVGVYENREIMRMACKIMHNKLVALIQAVDDDVVPISLSETTMENNYDIILENEDYTIGKVLEYLLYEQYYQDEKVLNFCGFRKLHPHDSESRIRVGYISKTDKNLIRQHLRIVCIKAQEIFEQIKKMF